MNDDRQVRERFEHVDFGPEPPMASTPRDDVRRGARRLRRRQFTVWGSASVAVAVIAMGTAGVAGLRDDGQAYQPAGGGSTATPTPPPVPPTPTPPPVPPTPTPSPEPPTPTRPPTPTPTRPPIPPKPEPPKPTATPTPTRPPEPPSRWLR